MMPTTLILTMVGLLFLLIVLVFIYVWIGRSRENIPEPKTDASMEVIEETFESLRAIIKDTTSSASELHRASDLILKHFDTITAHTLPSYKDLLQTLCVHPHTDSKLILRFERTLRSTNPQYSHEIEHALSLGLATRDLGKR